MPDVSNNPNADDLPSLISVYYLVLYFKKTNDDDGDKNKRLSSTMIVTTMVILSETGSLAIRATIIGDRICIRTSRILIGAATTTDALIDHVYVTIIIIIIFMIIAIIITVIVRFIRLNARNHQNRKSDGDVLVAIVVDVVIIDVIVSQSLIDRFSKVFFDVGIR